MEAQNLKRLSGFAQNVIPGMGGMDPRQMSMMMRKLGIEVKDIQNVQEIIVRTPDMDYIFDDATVSVMKAQGVETWQISGNPRQVSHEVTLKISDDDVKMVVEQTGCDEKAARQALEASGGDLAEAILALAD